MENCSSRETARLSEQLSFVVESFGVCEDQRRPICVTSHSFNIVVDLVVRILVTHSQYICDVLS